MRAFTLLWLVLPQTQRAKMVYQEHVHPFLQSHELAIDEFIASSHDRAIQAGFSYLKQAIELIKQHVLGLPPKQPSPPRTPPSRSYTQSLMERFNVPSSRSAFPIGQGGSPVMDFYGLLASAVTAATAGSTRSTDAQVRDLSASGTLIPDDIHGTVDRMSFIAEQRERLSVLMSALDKEARDLGTMTPSSVSTMGSPSLDGASDDASDLNRRASAVSGLSKSRSEVDFEKIDSSEAGETEIIRPIAGNRSASGSWLPWAWGSKAAVEAKSSDTDVTMGGTEDEQNKGKTSGLDL